MEVGRVQCALSQLRRTSGDLCHLPGMLGCHCMPNRRAARVSKPIWEEVRRGEQERITYERASRTWIVVSGYNGDRIFYRKAMLACGGRSWHHLAFEYPADQKRAFDQFVTRASYALKEYDQIGCPESVH